MRPAGRGEAHAYWLYWARFVFGGLGALGRADAGLPGPVLDRPRRQPSFGGLGRRLRGIGSRFFCRLGGGGSCTHGGLRGLLSGRAISLAAVQVGSGQLVQADAGRVEASVSA